MKHAYSLKVLGNIVKYQVLLFVYYIYVLAKQSNTCAG